MTDRQNGHDERMAGPFPGVSHERPWESAETDHGPFERRRAGDRRGPNLDVREGEDAVEATGRRSRSSRRRADLLETDSGGLFSGDKARLMRRVREPLIGLTLAGVAVPLVNAGVNPGEDGPRLEGEAEADMSATATAERGDLDEAVGDYWAESEEEVVRASTIEGAITRYGIDRDLAEKIFDAAVRHEIEPDVAYGLVNTESTFRDRAVSHVGARGLTQVMPRTAKWLDPTISTSELFNQDKNLDLGFKYLRMMIDKYGGDVENALTAYNRGPGTVDKILKRGGNPDNGYAGKVLGG